MHQPPRTGITLRNLLSRREFAGLVPALFIPAGVGLLGCSRVVSPTYYVNNSTGADDNDGRSAATAWQSVAKVSAAALAAGDVVAFCGGQRFTGNLVVSTSGAPIAPITFSSYGIGRATISALDPNTPTFAAVNKSYITIDGVNFVGNGTLGTGAGIYFSATSAEVTGINDAKLRGIAERTGGSYSTSSPTSAAAARAAHPCLERASRNLQTTCIYVLSSCGSICTSSIRC
jgi:hypothetical protein